MAHRESIAWNWLSQLVEAFLLTCTVYSWILSTDKESGASSVCSALFRIMGILWILQTLGSSTTDILYPWVSMLRFLVGYRSMFKLQCTRMRNFLPFLIISDAKSCIDCQPHKGCSRFAMNASIHLTHSFSFSAFFMEISFTTVGFEKIAKIWN